MYQFSRAIYRELSGDVLAGRPEVVSERREQLLRTCESAMERLATDRHYFARPVRTLFNDTRCLFPMNAQLRVYRISNTTCFWRPSTSTARRARA